MARAIKPFHDALQAYSDPAYRYTLPPVFYTSEDWLAHESDTLFRREWLCLGRVAEVPEPGDFFTTELLGEPLLIVRGEDGEVRVLPNVCRHRNMQLAEGQGNKKRFVCPYHAWTYHTDGRLLVAPLMEETIDKSRCGLPHYKVEVWQGFLFVNLDGKARPLATRLGRMDEILVNYHSDAMHHVFVTEEVWPANWKCLVENFMEGYHLSVVHPRTLGGRTPTRLSEKFAGGKAFTGYRAHYPKSAPLRGKCHPDLTGLEKSCSTLFSIFPALVVSQASDVLVYMSVQPEGVDQVKIRWGISVYDATMSAAEVQSRIDLWQEVNAEDREKLGRVQRALHSRSAVSSALAPDDYEGTIRDFYGYLHSRMSGG